MTKRKAQKNALIGVLSGVVIYGLAWGWASYTAAYDIGVGANIGAGLLGLFGKAVGACSFVALVGITIFKRS